MLGFLSFLFVIIFIDKAQTVRRKHRHKKILLNVMGYYFWTDARKDPKGYLLRRHVVHSMIIII